MEEFRLARFKEDGSYIEGGFLIMTNQLQPGNFAALIPGFGVEHRKIMKQLPHIGGTIVDR